MENVTPYLIPPAVTLLVCLILAGIALWVPPRTTERKQFAVICLWWGMLAPAFISHHLLADASRILLVERIIHGLYVFLPALNLAFVYRLLDIQNSRLIKGAFLLSGLLVLTVPTPLYFNGLYTYSWGTIAKGGPAFQIFGVYCLVVLITIVWQTAQRIRKEKNPFHRRKQAYIIFSFCGAGFLTLLNIPAINGIDIYPAGNLVFLPLSLLAYGVLKFRLMDVRNMLLQIVSWGVLSSLVLLPNLLFLLWLHKASAATNLLCFALLMASWFLFNYVYIWKLQLIINRRFLSNRRHLDRAVGGFITGAVFLKDLDGLMAEFSDLVRRWLGIQQPIFYLDKETVGSMVNPVSGDQLTLPDAVARLFVSHPLSVGIAMLDTNPVYAGVAPDLHRLMTDHDAEYVVPLVHVDGLVGLVLLPAPDHGAVLSSDEVGFLDRLPGAGLAFSNSVVYQNVADLTKSLATQTVALTREIEERKRIEEALRQSEAKHRFLAENIKDVIWTRDMSLRLTYISPAVEKMSGWSADEYMQLPIEKIMSAENLAKSRAKLQDALQQAKSTGDYSRYETFDIELYTRSGGSIQAEITALWMVDGDGLPTGILGVTRDVTPRWRIQRERAKLREQLERSKKMEALGLLAGGVAHDLNNILSGIMSYPDLIIKSLPDDSSLLKPLKVIERSGQRAAAVVDDLLTIARGVAKSRVVTHLNLVVNGHLKSAGYTQLRAKHPHVQVTVMTESDPWHVNCSVAHVDKALTNLLTNAMEAMTRAGEVTIQTENRIVDRPISGDYAVPAGNYAVLSVADMGDGIGPEDLNQIFEPFFTRKMMGRSGTGLGLAVVWNTVHDHGGYVTVSSGDTGTRFDLYFPVTRSPLVADAQPVPVDKLKGHGETILVVDDDPMQREIAVGMLKFLGYTVDAVASGEDAVARVHHTPIDLLLLDMIMPQGMNGRETYASICKIRPGQKAVIASGFSETEEVNRAQDLGAGALLKKPYSLESLGQAIMLTLTGGDRGDGL